MAKIRLKDGDALIKQQRLEQSRTVWDFFIRETIEYIQDWLHWIEYGKVNLN